MASLLDPIVSRAHQQFSASVMAVLAERGMNKADLARALKAVDGPSKKTVYNILNGTHPPNIGQWAQIAKALDIPLWVLLIDDFQKHKDLHSKAALRRLTSLIENYLLCTDTKRDEVETVARAGAITRQVDKSR